MPFSDAFEFSSKSNLYSAGDFGAAVPARMKQKMAQNSIQENNAIAGFLNFGFNNLNACFNNLDFILRDFEDVG